MIGRTATVLPLKVVGLAALALAACSQPTTAQDVAPRPDGPVLDEADVFPAAQEAALDAELTQYWRETGVALVVVTDKSLDGRPIEDVAFETFNQWGVGNAETDRGLLVLLAPNDREVRIEVGCGLNRVVTDLKAKAIIEDRMLPLFKQGDVVGGTLAGVEELKRAATGPAITDAPLPPLCRENAG